MKTKSRKQIGRHLEKLLSEEPEMHKVENRYRTIRYALMDRWPNTIKSMSKESMCEFIKDTLYLDRKLRQLTEGEQGALKKELSEEAQIELGYAPGYHADIRNPQLDE